MTTTKTVAKGKECGCGCKDCKCSDDVIFDLIEEEKVRQRVDL